MTSARGLLVGIILALPFHSEAAMEDAKPKMTPAWEHSPIWQQYKEYYAEFTRSSTQEEAGRTWEKSTHWDRSLDQLFSQDDSLSIALRRLLFIRYGEQLRATYTRIARLPRPELVDWEERLAEQLPKLDVKYNALRGLREAGGRDP